MNNHPQFDPCAHLNEINLDSDDDLREVLYCDKHSRIEGLCSEIVFEEDLLASSFSAFSSGWWFTASAGAYHVSRLTLDVKSLTSLDYRLLKIFSAAAHTRLVQFDCATRSFRRVRIQSEADIANVVQNWHSLSSDCPRSPKSSTSAGKQGASNVRLEKACDFLARRKRLRDAAISRVFANCWLGASTFDIDYFAEHNGRIIAFEMKQKFPYGGYSLNCKFGLNRGEAQLLNFLCELGIRCVNVILTKPVWDENISGIDQHSSAEYRPHARWLAYDFTPATLRLQVRTAPRKTSIHGQQTVDYFEIPITQFHILDKKLGDGQSNALQDYLNGKTALIQSITRIPKIQPTPA